MFLRSLTLENVRNIKELELPFSDDGEGGRHWTLLLGENGCGKSTVLRAIALALAGSNALAELLGDCDSWIRRGAKRASIGLKLSTKKGEEREISLVIERDDNIKDVISTNRKALDDIDAAVSHSKRSYFTIGYGVSRRLNLQPTMGDVASASFRDVRARSVATLFAADAQVNPLEAWAMDLHYQRGDEGQRIIAATLSDLLPDIHFHRIDARAKRLLFRTADGIVPLSMLSDGFQNIASWCGDLIYRVTDVFSDYRKPLEARGVLLIDEIDLHLHPVRQRGLMTFIGNRLPNFQVVATTHSPLLAQQAGEGELFVLRRPNTKSSPKLVPYSGAPRNLMLHQIVTSPIFGLATLDSEFVEKRRSELRALKTKKGLSAPEKRRLRTIRSYLADVPTWGADLPLQRKSRRVASQLRTEVERLRREKPAARKRRKVRA